MRKNELKKGNSQCNSKYNTEVSKKINDLS